MAVKDNLGTAGTSVSLTIDGEDFLGSATITTPVHPISVYNGLPYDSDGATFVMLNNRLHMFGGTSHQKSHYMYNGFFWKKCDDLPFSLVNGIVACNNSIAWIFNATDSHYRAWIYDGESFRGDEYIAIDEDKMTLDSIASVDSKYITVFTHAYSDLYGANTLWKTVYDMDGSGSESEEVPVDLKGHITATNVDGRLHVMGDSDNSYGIMDQTGYINMYSDSKPVTENATLLYVNGERHIFWGDDKVTHHAVANNTSPEWTNRSDIDLPCEGATFLAGKENIMYFHGTDFMIIPTNTIGYNCRLDDRNLVTLPAPTYLSSSGVKAFYLNGKLNLIVTESSVSKWYRYNGSVWSEICVLPGAMVWDCATVLNGLVYVLIYNSARTGGEIIYSYDEGKKVWEEVVNAPTVTTQCALFTHNSKICFMSVNTLYQYTNSPLWMVLTNKFTDTKNFRVVSDGVYIHRLGGTSTQKLHQLWDGVSVTTLGELPVNVDIQTSVTTFEGEVHILGGPNGTTTHYRCIDNSIGASYSYEWRLCPPLHETAQLALTVVNDTDIELIGGISHRLSHYGVIPREWKKTTLPDQIVGGSPFVFKNSLFVAYGNVIYKKTTDTTWKKYSILEYAPNDDLVTSTLVEIPETLINGGVVVIGDLVHFFGGTGTMRNKHFTWDGKMWTKLDSLPYDFYNGAYCMYHGELHLFGGGATGSTTHYKYKDGIWTKLQNMPYKFGGGKAVVYKNAIHLVGNLSSLYPTYHYKWSDNKYTMLDDLPYSLVAGEAFVYDDGLYIAGSSADSTVVTNMYRWDESNEWVKQSTLPFNFAGGMSAITDNRLHLIGTTMDTNNATSDFEIFPCKEIQTLSSTDTTGGQDKIRTWTGITQNGVDYYPAIPNVIENNSNPDYNYCKQTPTGPVPLFKIPWVKNLILWSHVVWVDNKLLVFLKKYTDSDKYAIENVLYAYDEYGFNFVMETPDLAYQRPVIQKGVLHVFGTTNRYEYSDGVLVQKEALPYTQCDDSDVVGAAFALFNSRIHMFGSTISDNAKLHYSFNGSEWVREIDLYNSSARTCVAVISNSMYYLNPGSGSSTRAYKYDGHKNIVVSGKMDKSNGLIYVDGVPVTIGQKFAISIAPRSLIMWF